MRAGRAARARPAHATGYWQQPRETREAFFEDGWFRTGGIAKVDEQGCYFLLDRRKDMILVSGFNVFLADAKRHDRHFADHGAMADPILSPWALKGRGCQSAVSRPAQEYLHAQPS